MDFQKLLSIADRNKAAAQYEASVKRYSTELAPPKKVPRSNVPSDAIKQFLAKKQAEEQLKAEEAKRKRDALLSLRAQNTKNNKKAKIMASRTKDNDFSKIKLTEDEVEAKRKREAELLRLSLNDKVQRMKVRIEMEEKEKLLPKKRKRKSKHSEDHESESQNKVADFNGHGDFKLLKEHDKNSRKDNFKQQQSNVKKSLIPPVQQNFSFQDLLKMAAEKQYEPIVLPKVKKDDDERPLTKKEKRLLIEEENRIKRKLAAQSANHSSVSSKPTTAITKQKLNSCNSIKNDKIAKNNGAKHDMNQVSDRKPTVIRVQKDTRAENIPRNSMNGSNNLNLSNKQVTKKKVEAQSSKPFAAITPGKSNQNSFSSPSNLKPRVPVGNKGKANKEIITKNEKQKLHESNLNKNKTNRETKKKGDNKEIESQKEKRTLSSNGITEKMLADIEKRIRNQVQKEIEATLKQHNASGAVSKGSDLSSSVSQNKQTSNPSFRTNGLKKTTSGNATPLLNKAPGGEKVASGKSIEVLPKPKQGNLKSDNIRMDHVPPAKKLITKPSASIEKVKKPAFHPNPYLEPPRRLLESQRPLNRMKRKLESDEDDDDDDDDMSDFIDDGPLHDEQEDYSKYIKEIFGYDRSRYIDDDDDDIIESSFAEQMKEEVRSAKIGYLEDLEDMKKEEEEMKRKKMKKKIKK